MPPIHSIAPVSTWVLFAALIIAFIAFDLGVLQRKSHEVSLREAGALSVMWITVAALFGCGVYFYAGRDSALEFATGYLLEKALAVDNLFVFALIFNHLRLPPRYQHRVLVWGVLGAIVLRALFIAAGSLFVAYFSWALYVFGVLLVILGIRLAFASEKTGDLEESSLLRALRRVLPTTTRIHGRDFWAREDGKLRATPLFVGLVFVELCDVLFALDSLPAIFAVTHDPFLVFSSNILAILGLRALYFLLAHLLDRFKYLRYGLALTLCLIGAKLLLKDVIHLPVIVTLAVTLSTIVGATLISFLVVRRTEPEPS
ncbi:MAG TPA: TerC family protein [Polyangiaceae bacterium]|nr:TerC family protein [Polyangiaceae bacterium]